MKKVFKYCLKAFKSEPKLFALSCVYIALLCFARLGVTYSFKFISDYIVLPSGNIHIIVTVFSFLFICNFVCAYNSNLTELLNILKVKKFRQLIYSAFMNQAHISKQDLFYNADFYNRYSFVKEHIDDVVEICITIFNKLFASVISMLISVVAITAFSPYMFIIISACSLLMIFINRYTVKEKIHLNNRIIPEERKAAYFFDLMSGRLQAKEIRVFELGDILWKKWDTSYCKFLTEKYKLDQKVNILMKIPSILQQVSLAFLTIYFLYLVDKGRMSVGEFTFLFGMMMIMIQEINNLIDIFTKDIAEKIEYIKAFDSFINQKQFREEALADSADVYTGLIKFKDLVIKNLSYKYPGQSGNAVTDVSMSIHKGEVICLLGYNGSGKSTLSKIICGLLEDYEGSIYINGKDLKNINREDIFRMYGIGFQDFAKYAISVKENIQVGMIEDSSNESLQKAKENANIHKFIDTLPFGEDTVLGKEYDFESQDISGGQWQKVILARAYMGEPDFFILDEPTAAIDPLEEMKLLGNIRNIIADKTALIVAHRIGFAKTADRILFMKNGSIVESGSHEELLKLKGEYYRIFHAQKELYGGE